MPQDASSIDQILKNSQVKKPETSENDIVLNIKSTDNVKAEKGPKITSLLDIYNSVNDWLINASGIKLQEKLEFFQLLGTVINAGISLNDSLAMLGGQQKNPKFKRVIEDVRQQIEDGESLADSLEQNDDVFDQATCAIVRAGEKSGKLTEVLKELSKQYERMNQVAKKVKSVMTYPIIVFIVMILLTIVVVVFIVPKLVSLFGDRANLPLPTRILVGLSDFVIHQWWLLILGLVCFAGLFLLWKKSQTGRRQWDTILLSLPLVSPILKGMILSRVTRIFGFLIASGVPIIEGLRISANIAQNSIYHDKLILAADDLGKGIPIAENLSDDEKLFPQMLVNMIAIGEQSASLEGIMGHIANFYDEEIERKIKNLSKIMEPFILAIIASAAVFMMLAIYLPILKMNDQVLGA